jgi:hypothetical protein
MCIHSRALSLLADQGLEPSRGEAADEMKWSRGTRRVGGRASELDYELGEII